MNKKLLSMALALTILATTANIAIPINAFAENETSSTSVDVIAQETEISTNNTVFEETTKNGDLITNNDYEKTVVSGGAVLAPENSEVINPVMTPENKAKLEECEEMLMSQMTTEDISLFSNDISLFSTSSDAPTFNQYLADYNYNYNCYSFYKNDFVAPYRSFVETRLGDPVWEELLAAWRIATFQLSDLATYNSKEIGFYETILYDVLYQGSEVESLSGNLKKITDTVQASSLKKISKSLSKNMGEIWKTSTNDMSLVELEDLNYAMQTCDELTEVFGAIGNISKVLGYVDNVEELIYKMAKAQAIMESSNQTAKILLTMKNHTTNKAFKEALSNMILICSEMINEENVLEVFASDLATSELGKFVLDTSWGKVVQHLNVYGYAVSAGQAAGKWLTGLLFGTDKSVEFYYSSCALYEFENCLKYALLTYESSYLSNKSDSNSSLFNEAYKMLLQNHLLGIKASIDMVELEYKTGLINTLLHCFDDKEYDSYMSLLNRIQSMIELTIEFMGTIAYNGYLDEYGGEELYYTNVEKETPKRTQEEANAAAVELQDLSFKVSNVEIKENWKLTDDMFTYGSLYLKGGTLDLNGHTLTITGNVYQSGGTMKINGGKGEVFIGGNYNQSGGLLNIGDGFIQIGGNYRAENNFQDGDCNLIMQDENGYMLVNGDFYVAIDRDSNGLLTAGTLELKGDFTQCGDRRGWMYSTDTRTAYGFCPTEKHKVIFSGNTQQNINRIQAAKLNYPECSYFNIVKSTNQNVVFTNDFFVKNIEKGSVFKDLKIKNLNLSNTEFQVNGTFYAIDTMIADSTITTQTLHISSGTTTLENSELKVIGNADHKGGNLTVETGNLLVDGNYNHTGGELIAGKGYTEIKGNYSATGTCNLVMQDESGYVLIYGDYYVEKDNASNGYLTAGILELKGNFRQYGGKRGLMYLGNPADAQGFCGSDKHTVILSGEEKQTIYTQSTGLFGNLFHYPACSYFNILKIKNTSVEGVDFTSTVYVLDDIEQPTGTNISNKESVYLNNKSAFVDYGELNPTINAYVFNAADVIPTYMDYEEYMATQILSIELENIKMEQNKITGNLLFDNKKTDFENIVYIIAAYADDELINCEITPISIKYKETKNINFSLDFEKKATDVKAFVWTDLETMLPLCESVSRTIQ